MTSNLRKTLEAVEANPGHWNQRHWHCGTNHCFAGFADLLIDNYPVYCESGLTLKHSRFVLKNWLGITHEQWESLIRKSNRLDDLRRIVNEIEAERAT